VAACLDKEAFDRELQRVTPTMQAVGQDPEEAAKKIREVLSSVEERKNHPSWYMQFLYSPSALLSSDGKNVTGLRMEENILEPRNGDTRAKGTGKTIEAAADTVIFAIGDSVSDELDIPIKGNAYTLSDSPRYPVDGNSYELMDENAPGRLEGIFVTGWARNASAGMVGIARKEGTNAARAIMDYLHGNQSTGQSFFGDLSVSLKNAGYIPVTLHDLAKLEDAEKKQALENGLSEFKFDTNEEMLKVMGVS
jgi:ferredoxin--NADP+ reductase